MLFILNKKVVLVVGTVDMWTTLFFFSKTPVNKRKLRVGKVGGQPVFFGGENCGKFVEKWKYIQSNRKRKVYKYKKYMYKNKNKKLSTGLVNKVDNLINSRSRKVDKKDC